MTLEENALLPEFLHNTKMGKGIAKVNSKIRGRKTELGVIFKENGIQVAETTTDEALSGSFSDSDLSKIFFLGTKNINMGLTHNHPVEVTLSAQDILTFFNTKLKLIMATTPTNGYSVFYRTKGAIKFNKGTEFTKDFDKLLKNEEFVGFKIYRENLNIEEALKKMDKFRDKQLKKFVSKYGEKYGLKYEYKVGHSTSNKKIDVDFKNEIKLIYEEENAFLKDYRHWSDEKIEKYFKKIDDTPIEDYFIK